MARAFLLFLLLVSGVAFGFKAGTHRYIAEQVVLPYFPGCEKEIDAGAVAPDSDFHDTARHHCYPEKCMVGDSRYCPEKNDCPARPLAANYTTKAEFEPEKCRKAYYYAVASHYLADTHVVFHNTVQEDESCHSGLEEKIDKAAGKNPENFEVSIACSAPKGTFAFSSADLRKTISDVQDFTGLAPRKMQEDYSLIMLAGVVLAGALLVMRRRGLLSRLKHNR